MGTIRTIETIENNREQQRTIRTIETIETIENNKNNRRTIRTISPYVNNKTIRTISSIVNEWRTIKLKQDMMVTLFQQITSPILRSNILNGSRVVSQIWPVYPKIEKCEYLSLQFPTDFFGLSGDPHSFYEYYSAPKDERHISNCSKTRSSFAICMYMAVVHVSPY